MVYPLKKYKIQEGESFMGEKGVEGRLLELKDKYEAVNDFDFTTILELEDEYKAVAQDSPDHTRKRSEILEMRRRLLDRLNVKPKSDKEDIYVDVSAIDHHQTVVTIYDNGTATYINSRPIPVIADIIESMLKDKKVYIDTRGIGRGLADELDARNIKYHNISINRI